MARKKKDPFVGKRSVSVQQLRAEAKVVVEALLADGNASEQEIANWRPGGAENPGRDALAELKFYRLVHRCHEKYSRHTESPDSANDLMMLDVLRGAPIEVTCVAQGPHGKPIIARVYPKSFHAMIEIAKIDKTIAWLAAHYAIVSKSQKAGDLLLGGRVMEEQRHQYQRLAWIVTHEGPGVPFPDGDVDTEPGEWIKGLEVADLFRINGAHHRVNQLRLAHLSSLISEKTGNDDGERPSWTVFIGTASEALKIRPEVLMRDWSLAAVLVQMRTTAHVRREAVEDAKRDHHNAG